MQEPDGPSSELARTGSSPVRRLGESVRSAVPVVRRVAREATRLALLSAAGGAVIWSLAATRLDPGPDRAGRLVLVAVVLAVPPAILLLVSFALRQVASIPDRLGALPEEARSHAGEIGKLAGEARRVRQRGWFRTAVSVLRLWRTAGDTRALLEGAAPVAFLLSPATWIAAPLAAVAGVLEILLGAGAALWLVLG